MDDVGPDDGLDAPEHGVDGRQHTHHQNAEVDVDPGHGREGDGGQEQHDRHASELVENERCAGEETYGDIEAEFEVLVSAGQLRPAEERQIDEDHRERDQDDR